MLQLSVEEKVFIKNKKGLKLATLINRPEEKGHFPVLLILSGFTEYKEHIRLITLAKELSVLGIGSIRFDSSGYGESDGTVEKDYRFSNYVDDSQVIFDFVSNLDWVDKEKIAVFGESMGGVQALILTKNNAPKVSALVLVSSPIIMGSDEDLKGKYKNWEKDGYTERVSSKYGKFKVPFDFIQDARQWNGMDYIRGLDVPLQVIVGTNDVNVSPHVTKKLYDAAVGPKELKIIEGADHFLNRDPKMIEEVMHLVADYLAKKLL